SFSVVLFASVLHHIPDYVATIEAAASRVVPGGALVTFQDPLWYPTVPRAAAFLSRFAYFWWRIRQGNYVRGISSRWRWMRGVYDDRNPSDMVEYHVVRRGVSQDALREALSSRFRYVRVISYWSTQSAIWQRIGEALGAQNTFGIVATDRCS